MVVGWVDFPIFQLHPKDGVTDTRKDESTIQGGHKSFFGKKTTYARAYSSIVYPIGSVNSFTKLFHVNLPSKEREREKSGFNATIPQKHLFSSKRGSMKDHGRKNANNTTKLLSLCVIPPHNGSNRTMRGFFDRGGLLGMESVYLG